MNPRPSDIIRFIINIGIVTHDIWFDFNLFLEYISSIAIYIADAIASYLILF